MCDQIKFWPHGTIKNSLRSLYGFASDYPGIRHGGNPNNVIRAIEMRDMLAMSMLLVGFTPYLTASFDAETLYQGG